MKKILIPLLSIFIISAFDCQKTKILSATDDTYGYTMSNPIRLKKGGIGKSMEHTLQFLKLLRTEDDQTLELVKDSSLLNQFYEPMRFYDSYTRVRIQGKERMIDKYWLVTSVSKDTIILYVDTNESKPLLIPVGLKYSSEKN